MYATRIEGQVLNLAVSGKLWRRSLVMIDEETKTLWSQLLAKGMEGKHKGVPLKILPSTLTDWKTWKEKHPSTTVINMTRTGKEFRNSFYSELSKFVVGLNRFGKAKAWPFDELKKQPLVNDHFDGNEIVIFFEESSATGHIYERMLEGQSLDFKFANNKIIDAQTESEWDLALGKAISGKLKDKKLKALPAIPSFRKSWMVFHPNSEIWNANQ